LWLVVEPRRALVRGTDDEADPAWSASQCKRVGARHRGVSRCAQHRSPTLCLDQVRGSDPGEYRALRTRHHGHPSRTTYLTNHCYRTLGGLARRPHLQELLPPTRANAGCLNPWGPHRVVSLVMLLDTHHHAELKREQASADPGVVGARASNEI